jgi:hypothetical protein
MSDAGLGDCYVEFTRRQVLAEPVYGEYGAI